MVAHGVEDCKDCRNIVEIIVTQKPNSIRFNALLRLCKDAIDQKYSAPRLQRHLKGLEKTFPFLKRTEKGRQNVEYSINIPKHLTAPYTLDLKQKLQELSTLHLAKLIRLRNRLYKLIALEQTIDDLEEKMNRITSQEHRLRRLILHYLADLELGKLNHAIASRSVSEFKEVLKKLKDERDRIRSEKEI